MTATDIDGVNQTGAGTTPPLDHAEGSPVQWRAPRGYVAAVAILVAIGFALAALTLVFASRLGDDRAGEVRRTAADFATALLTYDHADLDATKTKVLSYATAGFKKQYEDAFSGGLDVILKETQARSRVVDVVVYVNEVEDNAASAIAVVDTIAEGSSGARRTLDSYVQLEMVKVSGAWKVAAVINLNFGQTDDGVLPGGSPTTVPPRASK